MFWPSFGHSPRREVSQVLRDTHQKHVLTDIGFTQDMITEFIKILKIQVDYSDDAHHDGLVRNGSLQSCLSIMNALGFHGELQPRSFHGKYAMLSLNVRNVVVLVTIASNTPLTYREKLSPLDEPGKFKSQRLSGSTTVADANI